MLFLTEASITVPRPRSAGGARPAPAAVDGGAPLTSATIRKVALMGVPLLSMAHTGHNCSSAIFSA